MKITWNTDVFDLSGLSKRDKKKAVNAMAGQVMKDKEYRRSMKGMGNKTAKAVARAAVKVAVERTEAQQTAEANKKSALDTYTDLVARFAKARRKRAKAQKKNVGKLNVRTGLVVLARLPKDKKAKKAKKVKPYKAKNVKKV